MKKSLERVSVLPINPELRKRFKSGELMRVWSRRYKKIFDVNDRKLAKSQNERHFYEWLAAILLYQSTGYISLIEKYQFSKETRKRAILDKLNRKGLISDDLLDLMINRKDYGFGRTQCPDLFLYSPDFSDWFFCEVKGPRDRVKEMQKKYFEKLSRLSRKPILFFEFKNMKEMNRWL